MVVVPALTAVTRPLSFIVATVTSELVHGLLLAGVPLPSKSVVASTHTDVVPVIIGAAGSLKVTLNVEVPVQLLPLVIDKFAYVPADNPITVAVPLDTEAEADPLS